MRERVIIGCGLVLFVSLFAYPVWHGVLARKAPIAPELKLSTTDKQCVLPTAEMRAAHMQLLNRWRTISVRDGVHTYTAFNGRKYDIGLSSTCTSQCHSKQEFCDRCHSYAGVSGPYCWDCHVDRNQLARSAP
jgi:hypothetical protein